MAPPPRSSIASATSTSNSKCDPAVRKKFTCTFPGCGKCFSRAEHLHRHALNHKDGNNTCLRCMAHFRRRDLLDRHMARHKEKDDEAGGEGLGVLATRKRLWMDANGNIVNAPRPTCTKGSIKRKLPRVPIVKKESSIKTISDDGRPISLITPITDNHILKILNEPKTFELSQDPWLEITTQNSSPISEFGVESVVQNSRDVLPENLETLYEDPWSMIPNGLQDVFSNSSVMIRQHDYTTTAGSISNNNINGGGNGSSLWGGQQFQTFIGSVAEVHSDDIFKHDPSIYNWQAWNSQVVTSRCREERVDTKDERKREWLSRFDRVCA